MTDVVRKSGEPAKSRKPGFLPTIAVAVATFAVLFEFLAFQLSSGTTRPWGPRPSRSRRQRRRPPQRDR